MSYGNVLYYVAYQGYLGDYEVTGVLEDFGLKYSHQITQNFAAGSHQPKQIKQASGYNWVYLDD